MLYPNKDQWTVLTNGEYESEDDYGQVGGMSLATNRVDAWLMEYELVGGNWYYAIIKPHCDPSELVENPDGMVGASDGVYMDILTEYQVGASDFIGSIQDDVGANSLVIDHGFIEHLEPVDDAVQHGLVQEYLVQVVRRLVG